MIKIRLTRKGSRKKPFYQIIVTDSRNSRDGKFIENLGFLNPLQKNKKENSYFKINKDRIKYWITCGAQFSKRVNELIKNNEISLKILN